MTPSTHDRAFAEDELEVDDSVVGDTSCMSPQSACTSWRFFERGGLISVARDHDVLILGSDYWVTLVGLVSRGGRTTRFSL